MVVVVVVVEGQGLVRTLVQEQVEGHLHVEEAGNYVNVIQED